MNLSWSTIDVCVKQNPHFKDLELADWADQGSTLEVDVLIGSDWTEDSQKDLERAGVLERLKL